jgi:TRAP-type C4-dicarboxylate transport system substrate-binding protein
MKRTFVTVLVVSLLSLWVQPLTAQTVTLRLGHVGFPGSLFAITTDEYAKRANAAVKSKVEVKVFHSSQLGSDEQMMRGIKIGAPEMFAPSTVMSTAEQKFGVFEMPYSDREPGPHEEGRRQQTGAKRAFRWAAG